MIDVDPAAAGADPRPIGPEPVHVREPGAPPWTTRYLKNGALLAGRR